MTLATLYQHNHLNNLVKESNDAAIWQEFCNPLTMQKFVYPLKSNSQKRNSLDPSFQRYRDVNVIEKIVLKNCSQANTYARQHHVQNFHDHVKRRAYKHGAQWRRCHTTTVQIQNTMTYLFEDKSTCAPNQQLLDYYMVRAATPLSYENNVQILCGWLRNGKREMKGNEKSIDICNKNNPNQIEK